jgi:hypothetical protein
MLDLDPDPDEMNADPQPWFKSSVLDLHPYVFGPPGSGIEKNRFFGIMKVTEDLFTGPPDPFVRVTDPRIRIRIRILIKMPPIRNIAYKYLIICLGERPVGEP